MNNMGTAPALLMRAASVRAAGYMPESREPVNAGVSLCS